MHVKVRTQGGGDVWSHFGIISKIDEVYVDINHEDCSEVQRG
jgi:hypothetical protein